MNYPKINWLNLATTYLGFGLLYGAILWQVWNFLFSPMTGISITMLQGFGVYLICKILFGNNNTSYINNIYTPKSPDLSKIDEYLKDFEDKLNKESEEIEEQYKDLDKKN